MNSLLQQLVEISNDPDFYGHVFVLENHDMNVSRHLLKPIELRCPMSYEAGNSV